MLTDYPSDPPGGNRNWGTGFMPATYQGTHFRAGKTPILYVEPPAAITSAEQRAEIDLHQRAESPPCRAARTDDSLEARIAAYELAYRMQSARPGGRRSLAAKPAETQALYGLDQAETADNGRNCLLARRLVERGVRFVQLYMGSGQQWDAHDDLEDNHAQHLPRERPADRRIAQGSEAPRPARRDAGDLGRRVRPHADERKRQRPRPQSLRLHDVDGRRRRQGRHQSTARPTSSASTPSNDPAHVHDIHATILHLLGLDHEQLTFRTTAATNG